MVVVDTNIIAALFIRTRLSDDALKLRARDSLWCVDPFSVIEFSNVLATYERAGFLTRTAALEQLGLAEEFLSPNYLHVSNEMSLQLALRYRVTAYDARFLAVAEHFGQKLVTDDVKLRTAAPALTQSVDEALSLSTA
jgi:predicted nucleic acid-binding protein